MSGATEEGREGIRNQNRKQPGTHEDGKEDRGSEDTLPMQGPGWGQPPQAEGSG